MKDNFEHEYLMTSERHYSDEIENHIYTNEALKIGDFIIMDGIRWYVDEVIK